MILIAENKAFVSYSLAIHGYKTIMIVFTAINDILTFKSLLIDYYGFLFPLRQRHRR